MNFESVKPTRYKEINFKSLLEVRWALFFDCLGVRWKYEVPPETVKPIPNPFYLPDFWLPDYETFVEIKASVCAVGLEKPASLALKVKTACLVMRPREFMRFFFGCPGKKFSDRFGQPMLHAGSFGFCERCERMLLCINFDRQWLPVLAPRKGNCRHGRFIDFHQVLQMRELLARPGLMRAYEAMSNGFEYSKKNEAFFLDQEEMREAARSVAVAEEWEREGKL